MNEVIVVQAITFVAGVITHHFYGASKAKRLRVESEKSIEQVKAESEKSFMEGTRLVAEQCAALQIEVERAREVAGDERAKSERYFRKISDFEAQRTDWQERYYAQTIGHGNAQELMMTTIENLARQLQSLGQRPKIPSVLHALRSEYQSTHEMPVRAALEAIENAKALVAASQPTAETHPVET